MIAPADQTAAEALVQSTLQNLVGQGLDSASLTVMVTAPGNVPNQPHRNHSITASGKLDKTGTITVQGNSTNRVNQPVPTKVSTVATTAPISSVSATTPPA